METMARCQLSLRDTIAFNVRVAPGHMPEVLAPCWREMTPYNSAVPQIAPAVAPAAVAPAAAALAAAAPAAVDPLAALAQMVPLVVHPAAPAPATAPPQPVSPLPPPPPPPPVKQEPQPPAAVKEEPKELAPAVGDEEAVADSTTKTVEAIAKADEEPEALSKDDEPPVESHQDVFMGWVKSIHPESDCVMLACPESGYDTDVYVHKSVAEPSLLKENDTVAFKIHLNTEGRPQASAPLWRLSGYTDGEDVEFGEYVGKVSRMLPNGNAIIDCPAVKAVHGIQAYALSALAKQCDLNIDDVVSFNIGMDASENPKVSGPCWKSCSTVGIEGLESVLSDTALDELDAAEEEAAAAEAVPDGEPVDPAAVEAAEAMQMLHSEIVMPAQDESVVAPPPAKRMRSAGGRTQSRQSHRAF
eukprot:gnl/TRDRNA2_/TRDRNA2_175642_c1_seq1.p1 gnl/TRDRNA2_/TRDRNA2_175642_c1~~gnl/TRDRNA2_/TRDRNA2_175642_c1_seq1.p1  ORF type:complete len:450 (+),score=112.55 gnl/TRDRNA2_/TRDRNA2_175642_c1_seq1:108-1352(+)